MPIIQDIPLQFVLALQLIKKNYAKNLRSFYA